MIKWHATKNEQGVFVYLISTKPDDIGQLLNHKIDAFNAGLFKSGNLLFDYGLESHVGGEQTHAHTWWDKIMSPDWTLAWLT